MSGQTTAVQSKNIILISSQTIPKTKCELVKPLNQQDIIEHYCDIEKDVKLNWSKKKTLISKIQNLMVGMLACHNM